MNLNDTEQPLLDSAKSAPGFAVPSSTLGVSAPAKAVEAPESSTLVLLIVATALWLLRLRLRSRTRQRKV